MAAHSGFETKRRYYQKSKTGLSVAPQKRTYVLQNEKVVGGGLQLDVFSHVVLQIATSSVSASVSLKGFREKTRNIWIGKGSLHDLWEAN